jgi:hypothetical protein
VHFLQKLLIMCQVVVFLLWDTNNLPGLALHLRLQLHGTGYLVDDFVEVEVHQSPLQIAPARCRRLLGEVVGEGVMVLDTRTQQITAFLQRRRRATLFVPISPARIAIIRVLSSREQRSLHNCSPRLRPSCSLLRKFLRRICHMFFWFWFERAPSREWRTIVEMEKGRIGCLSFWWFGDELQEGHCFVLSAINIISVSQGRFLIQVLPHPICQIYDFVDYFEGLYAIA